MDERNMVFTSQSFDMETDQQGQDHLNPEPNLYRGNNGYYPHPNIYPLPAFPSANHQHFPNTHDSTVFYGSQFNGPHRHNPVMNMDLSASSFHNPCMVPPPSGGGFLSASHVSPDQLPSSSRHGAAGVGTNEFRANRHFIDNVGSSSKRKNIGMVLGNHQVNDLASSNSSYLGMPPPCTGMVQSEEQLESRMNGVEPVTGGRAESARSRSRNIGLQMESLMIHNTNYLVHGNYMGQSFQPAVLVEQQFGSTLNDGSMPTCNYAPGVPYYNVHGVVPSEFASMSGQDYLDSMNNRNSPVIFNPPMHPHHQFYPSPAFQAMYGHDSYHHQPLQPSFRQTSSNIMHHGTMNHYLDDSEFESRHSRQLPPNGLRIYRPHRSGVHQTVTADSNRPYLRYLIEDEVAILEHPGYVFELETSSDRHRDMRLDIEDMSYEELLALGERIGTVKTGLSEETIVSRLKTRVYASSATEDKNQEGENCIVCQVEYKSQERIGTLSCGHEYHADCIKRWLQVKNVCPICKVPAISEDGRKKTK